MTLHGESKFEVCLSWDLLEILMLANQLSQISRFDVSGNFTEMKPYKMAI